MSDMKTPVLSIRHLKQYFTSGHGKNKMVVKAVDDVSFDIYKGEVFGLVGESGCGKTTTGRTIIKLYEPTDGEVFFFGRRISAGIQGLKDAIRENQINTMKALRELKTEEAAALEGVDKERAAQIREPFRARRSEIIRQNREFIVGARREIADRRRSVHPDVELMKKMQMIFQDPIASLNPRMTVKEIVAEGLRIAGVKNDDIIVQKVNEVLETVNLLPEHASRYPHEFSGGQRQRIGIARALVVGPELIIADEPISALDVSIRAQVINLLNDLRDQLGLTIMFIAHDLSVIKYFSNRIGVMYYGKLVELATSDELFKNPLHPYTKSLLSAVPLPDPMYERNRRRIIYDPNQHDYKNDKPELTEITPGHFVLANQAELAKYRTELK
jgi:ABC-type oligopeptide transport system ATPase subunit